MRPPSPFTAHPARRGRSLDPRAVLIGALLLIVAVKGLHAPAELAWAAFALFALSLALGIPGARLLIRSVMVLPLSLAALPLVLTVSGPPLFTIAGWIVTVPGSLRFLEVVAQCWLCFQVLLIAGSLRGPFALVEALGQLGCPGKLVAVLRLCLRYIELLSEELRCLQRARQSRGGREPGLMFRARVTGQLVAVLFLRSLQRAERVEVAMRSRGSIAGGAVGHAERGRWGLAENLTVGLAAAAAVISWSL